MTKQWYEDIHDMHSKFGVREAVAALSPESLRTFIEFRLRFLKEELDEACTATSGDDLVDALIDLCVVAIGTMDALRVDPQLAWDRVHYANMQKEVGIKPSRPNPLGLPDLIKPAGWVAPGHADNIGLIERIKDNLSPF